MNGSARHGAQGDPATLFGWGMKHRADPLFRAKGLCLALGAYTPAWLAATIRPNRSFIAARERNEPTRGAQFQVET